MEDLDVIFRYYFTIKCSPPVYYINDKDSPPPLFWYWRSLGCLAFTKNKEMRNGDLGHEEVWFLMFKRFKCANKNNSATLLNSTKSYPSSCPYPYPDPVYTIITQFWLEEIEFRTHLTLGLVHSPGDIPFLLCWIYIQNFTYISHYGSFLHIQCCS